MSLVTWSSQIIKKIKEQLQKMCGNGTNAQQPSNSVTNKNVNASVKVATDDNFEQLVLKSDKPVLVDFYASWCGPCQSLAPKLEQMAQEYDGRVIIVKVDTDAHKRWMKHYQARRIPTLVFMQNGTEVKRTTGNLPVEQLRSELDSFIAGTPESK